MAAYAIRPIYLRIDGFYSRCMLSSRNESPHVERPHRASKRAAKTSEVGMDQSFQRPFTTPQAHNIGSRMYRVPLSLQAHRAHPYPLVQCLAGASALLTNEGKVSRSHRNYELTFQVQCYSFRWLTQSSASMNPPNPALSHLLTGQKVSHHKRSSDRCLFPTLWRRKFM